MISRAPQLFAPSSNRVLAETVAAALGVPLSPLEEREFEDGEHKSRPLVSVRGRDVYVIASLYGDGEQSPNDKLCRLLFLAGAMKDAAAGRVTVISPYLCYARKERKTKARDPVTTRYVAAMIEAVGVDRIVALDVHNLAAYQNAFRCGSEHLEAKSLFVAHFAPLLEGRPVTVMSPDAGGFKRAEAFRAALAAALDREVAMVFMEKVRSQGVVSGQAVVGEVSGRSVVVLDDLISTGGTLVRAARACRERGADQVFAAATHGLFVTGAPELMRETAIDRIVVTDSVPPFRLDPSVARERLDVLPLAPLLAAAIERLSDDGSIVELLESPARFAPVS